MSLGSSRGVFTPLQLCVATSHRCLAAFIALQQCLQTAWCRRAADPSLPCCPALQDGFPFCCTLIRETGTAHAHLTSQQELMAGCDSHAAEGLWSHPKPSLICFNDEMSHLGCIRSSGRGWVLPWKCSTCLQYSQERKNKNKKILCHLTSGSDVLIQGGADKVLLQLQGKHCASLLAPLCCWAAACDGLCSGWGRGRTAFAAGGIH